MLQFPLMKTSVTDWSTEGVNQSEPLEVHGKFLKAKQGKGASVPKWK